MENKKFFELQSQIRANSSNVKDYIEDLNQWEASVKKTLPQSSKSKAKQASSSSNSANLSKNIPPIRNSKQSAAPKKVENEGSDIFESQDLIQSSSTKKKSQSKNEENTKSGESEKFRRDKTHIKDYYQAWDQFDIAAELKKIEEDDESIIPNPERKIENENPAECHMLTKGAKPNSKIIIKGGKRREPNKEDAIINLKNAGNSYFTSLDYAKAIEQYSEALRLKPKSSELNLILLSNRAQSYLKLRNYKLAQNDATQALSINDSHLKSLHRRATAFYYLKQYREAKDDILKTILILTANLQKFFEEENEESAQQVHVELNKMEKELDNINNEIGKIKDECIEKMKYGGRFHTKQTKRILIEDINVDKKVHEMQQQKKQLVMKSTHVKKGLEAFLSDDEEEDDYLQQSKAEESGSKENEEEELKNKGIETNKSNKVSGEKSNVKKKKRKRNKKKKNQNMTGATGVEDLSETNPAIKGEGIIAEKEKQHQNKGTVEQEEKKTLKDIMDLRNSDIVSAMAAKDVSKASATKSASEIERDLNNIRPNIELLKEYVLKLNPPEFPFIFKESIQVENIIAFLQAFDFEFIKQEPLFTLEFLFYLSKVDRFQVNISFLSHQEKQQIDGIFVNLEDELRDLHLDGEENKLIRLEKLKELKKEYLLI